MASVAAGDEVMTVEDMDPQRRDRVRDGSGWHGGVRERRWMRT